MFALFNHDLRQIFVSATERPPREIDRECRAIAGDIVGWEARHQIEWVHSIAELPSLRHVQSYVAWLRREGAFEGAEHYAMGVDPAVSERPEPLAA